MARLLLLQLHHADPPARLGEWLRAAGLEVVDVDLGAGADVPALDGVDGLVVLGGAMGAWDDAEAPFLPAVRQLLRDAVSTQLPTLGVCLGAQLLAAAHGGKVVVNPNGAEVGAQLVAKRSAASGDVLFRPLPITPDVIQWHYDTVAELPRGATLLASSPMAENQAFRVGRLAWGIQFHIETTPEVVRTWARNDAARLRHLDLDLVVSRSDAVHDDLDEVWRPFTAAFADVVRDPSSAPAQPASAAPDDPVAAAKALLAGQASAARLPMPGLRRDG